MENTICIKQDVINRLNSIGYDVKEADNTALDFLIAFVEEKIKNFINLDVVPQGLKYDWINAVCCEFLKTQLSAGKIENVQGVMKSIKEGDTTVTFDDSLTPEKQFTNYLETLNLKYNSMARYRVMKW